MHGQVVDKWWVEVTKNSELSHIKELFQFLLSTGCMSGIGSLCPFSLRARKEDQVTPEMPPIGHSQEQQEILLLGLT